MSSRTVGTCEKILRSLIKQWGPTATVGIPLIKKAVIMHAGGDPRTVNRYFEHMLLLDYLKVASVKNQTFSLNWRKLDFAQLSLQESLLVMDEEPP